MKIKKVAFILFLVMTLSGCKWFGKTSGACETGWMKRVNSYIGDNKSGKYEAIILSLTNKGSQC